ncbi:hypothetical protein [uncultured Flavonifractor sp.]|uniref:hypothetical protein n=1 Tax=uncultured Flavonifractor sp. TaxID=1193534 RepID=UPI0025985F86|nr:hypothetical protein [uncultured Flavonifractor sp.]
MATSIRQEETVSSVFRYLVDRSGKTIQQIHESTKVPLKTLYSLYNRNNKKADMRMLKVLAAYFGEDLDIFCGLAGYRRKRLSNEDEMLLQQYETLSDDAKLQVMGLVMRLRANPENIVRLV